MDIETLAKIHHEICMEILEQTVSKQFVIGWDYLSEEQKNGKRFIAKKLLEIFNISKKGEDPGIDIIPMYRWDWMDT